MPMKNSLRYAFTAVLLFALGLVPITAHAIESASDTNVSVPADKTIEDDFAAAGSTIDIAGRINGNLYAGGSTIVASGPITGSLHAAGSELTLSGPVGDDLWAAGGTLTVRGAVAHNLGLAGGTITLAPGATVGRDAVVAGNQIVVGGSVGQDLRMFANTAVLSGHVAGSVEARVERLTLTGTAIVDRDVTVYGPNPPEIAPGAQVKGAVHYHPTAKAEQRTAFQRFQGWMAGWLFKYASVLVLGFALMYLFPTQIARVTEILRGQTGKALLVGAVALIAAPLGTLLVMVSLIGIPLAVCLGALYAVTLLVAVVPCAYLAGVVLSRTFPALQPKSSRWTNLILGALLVTLLTSLPYLSGIAEGLVLALGSGALLLFFRDLLLESKKG
jgi:cytoskeletal protein CcmA (bactofilin family)